MLRLSKSHQDSKVFFVELFFDLVFVYAISQLSHYLLNNLHWQGFAKTIFLTLAVWWVWIFTVWLTNWLNPQKSLVRILLFVLMLLGLMLSISIPKSFQENALFFAISYSCMQIGRSIFMLYILYKEQHKNHKLMLSIALWFILSSFFWISGAIHTTCIYYFWITALLTEYLAPIIGFWTPFNGRFHSKDWPISSIHMSERCALFVILSLGEALLEMGATFAEQYWSMHVIAALLVSFFCLIAMWWIYFSSSIENPHKHQNNKNTDEYKNRLGRTYTYVHIPIILGIILLAISDELVIAHPDGSAKILSAISILGGASSFLIGNLALKYIIESTFKTHHAFAILAMIALFFVHPYVSHLMLLFLATIILIITAILEHFTLWEIETSPCHMKQ